MLRGYTNDAAGKKTISRYSHMINNSFLLMDHNMFFFVLLSSTIRVSLFLLSSPPSNTNWLSDIKFYFPSGYVMIKINFKYR